LIGSVVGLSLLIDRVEILGNLLLRYLILLRVEVDGHLLLRTCLSLALLVGPGLRISVVFEWGGESVSVHEYPVRHLLIRLLYNRRIFLLFSVEFVNDLLCKWFADLLHHLLSEFLIPKGSSENEVKPYSG
jgi:hypothetical protein